MTDEKGRPAATPDAPETTAASTCIVPDYPTGGDPRRRIDLHYTLVKRRRWSKELDELCGRWDT